MKILVTGASGFIGGSVVRRLLSESVDTTVFVRDIKKHQISQVLKYKVGDLRDKKIVDKALNGIDVVINCAGVLPHHKLNRKEYWDINAIGVGNIVESCIKNKVKRLIHISTVGIYNRHKNSYSISKLAGEKFIKSSSFAKNSIILRPTICYGPGDTRPVFLKLFKMINKGVNISIGGGNNLFHTIYIDNLIEIIIKSISNISILGQDFNVGDLNCPKMKDITNSIIKSCGKRCVTIVVPLKIALFLSKILGIESTVRFVSDDLKYNMDKLKKYFKIKSDVGIEEGINKTFDWYVSNKII